MFDNNKILVVGTTADYITMLTQRFGDRLLFVTDFMERGQHIYAEVLQDCELLLDLEDEQFVLREVKSYLESKNVSLTGIVCFDCESLELAARIAYAFKLPFVSLDAVKNSRSKYISKTLWETNDIKCPATALIHSEKDAVRYFNLMDGNVVLKPLTGSGSELVFLCKSEEECRSALKILAHQLKHHPNRRMYSKINGLMEDDPRSVFVMEEFVPGEEYSCDFYLKDKSVRMIRFTKKIACHELAFGTILAYEILTLLPSDLQKIDFEISILNAASSLGITQCMGMVDFKIVGDQIVFLELTPRSGGDCLLALIEESSGLDMLQMNIDFVENKSIPTFGNIQWKPLVGIQLVAGTAGIINKIDTRSIKDDPRVIRVFIKKKVGERITLPPLDYDSRILGHVIFRPDEFAPVEQQCYELSNKLILKMENICESSKI